MTSVRNRLALLMTACAGLLANCEVLAEPILQAGTKLPAGYTEKFMTGYDFVPAYNQYVAALGFWDAESNGLPGTFQVGLWDTSTQMLLASAFIDSTDPIDTNVTVAAGQWRYENLVASVELAAGTTYTLAWQIGPFALSNSDSLYLNYASLGANSSVLVTNHMRSLDTSGDFAFPTIAFADSYFRAMGNAQLTSPPVPEPATLTLALAGTTLFGLAAKRRAQRRAAAANAPCL